jgi:hypothetical protein
MEFPHALPLSHWSVKVLSHGVYAGRLIGAFTTRTAAFCSDVAAPGIG